MTQALHEIQLKVWKELAISKQILMRTATDVLKLDPECTQDELQAALEGALAKVARADTDLQVAKDEAKAAIAALEKKLAASEQSLAIAQKAAADASAAHEASLQQLANKREAAATDLQKLRDQLTERDKALKAITASVSADQCSSRCKSAWKAASRVSSWRKARLITPPAAPRPARR